MEKIWRVFPVIQSSVVVLVVVGGRGVYMDTRHTDGVLGQVLERTRDNLPRLLHLEDVELFLGQRFLLNRLLVGRLVLFVLVGAIGGLFRGLEGMRKVGVVRKGGYFIYFFLFF